MRCRNRVSYCAWLTTPCGGTRMTLREPEIHVKTFLRNMCSVNGNSSRYGAEGKRAVEVKEHQRPGSDHYEWE